MKFPSETIFVTLSSNATLIFGLLVPPWKKETPEIEEASAPLILTYPDEVNE
jgi:hypothetical protein